MKKLLISLMLLVSVIALTGCDNLVTNTENISQPTEPVPTSTQASLVMPNELAYAKPVYSGTAKWKTLNDASSLKITVKFPQDWDRISENDGSAMETTNNISGPIAKITNGYGDTSLVIVAADWTIITTDENKADLVRQLINVRQLGDNLKIEKIKLGDNELIKVTDNNIADSMGEKYYYLLYYPEFKALKIFATPSNNEIIEQILSTVSLSEQAKTCAHFWWDDSLFVYETDSPKFNFQLPNSIKNRFSAKNSPGQLKIYLTTTDPVFTKVNPEGVFAPFNINYYTTNEWNKFKKECTSRTSYRCPEQNENNDNFFLSMTDDFVFYFTYNDGGMPATDKTLVDCLSPQYLKTYFNIK